MGRKPRRGLLCLLLALAAAVCLLPGMSRPAYAEDYNLWVGGVQVKDASSSGVGWSYDAATSTLALDGYDYGGDGHEFANDMFTKGYAAIYAEQDLTIQLSGTNTLANEKGDGFGVYVTGGNLTITGTDSDTLTATGTRVGIFEYGGNVTVNGGTVNAAGNSEMGNGILAMSGMGATSGIAITINGGKVTATGDEHGMSADAGDVTIAGGEVTATGNYGDGIYAGKSTNHDTQQTFGGNVTISGGEVTASGTRGNGIKGQDTVTIEGGEVSATSGMGDSAGILGQQRVAFEGGTVYAAGNGDEGIGVSSWNNIDFNGGTITVFGKARGIAEDISVSFATGVSARAGEDESAQPVADIEKWDHKEKWIQVREGSVQLWIDGDWVSEERTTGDGWSFDPETYTLTLDGFTYDDEGYQCGIDEGDLGQGTRRAGIYYAGPRNTLTICLKGESAVTVTNNGVSEVSGAAGNVAVGIWSERNVVVRAEEGGKLALTPQGHRSQGVQADSMTLENGELTVTTKNEAGGRYGVGVLAGDTLAIYGGTLTVKDESDADSLGNMPAITAKHIKMDDGRLNIDMSSKDTNGGVECVGNPAWPEDWNNFGTFELNGGSVNIKAETAVIMQNAYFMVNGGSAELEGSDAAVVASGEYISADDSMILGDQVYAKYGQSKDGAVFYEGEGNKVYQALRKVEEGTDQHPAAKYVRLEPAHTHDVGEGEGAQTITFRLWTDALAAQQYGWGPGNPNADYTAANSLPKEAGNYLLTKDVTLSGTWAVPEGETNLCLGGKTITGNLSKENNVIDIPANSTLNLYDDEEGTGKIVSKNYEVSGQPAKVTVVRCAGAFTMNGGTLSSVEGEKVQTGVYVKDGATFTMNGGTIQNADRVGVEVNAFEDAKGTFTMNGGTITGCATGVWDNGTFTMQGGSITANTLTPVVDDTLVRDGTGGGVYVGGGTFTMKDGTISKNSAHQGGGVYVGGGTFDMQGGSITQNDSPSVSLLDGAYTKGGDGGGVYVSNAATFAMSGGGITANTATGRGKGVHVFAEGTFNLSGNPDISGNSGQNVYLNNAALITVAGALSNATPIGVAMYEPGVFTTSTDPKAKDFLSNFTSDDSKYTVVTMGDELALQHNAHGLTYAASGATITATCDEKGLCDLTDKKVTLTVVAPTLTTYGQTGDGISEKATLDGLEAFNAATGKNVSVDSIQYFPVRQEGSQVIKTGEALSKAPTDAGDYMAEVTLTDVKTDDVSVTTVTAYVTYTIGKATPAFEHFAFAPPADLTYDRQAKAASVTAKNGVEGMGAVTVGYYSDAACTTAAEPKGVGTYYVGIKVAEGDNFYATADGTVLHGEGWTFRIAKPADAVALTGSGHVQGTGDVAARAEGNGILIGTEGQSKRLESFSVALPKDVEGSIEYRGHVQGKGWGDWVADGAPCGTARQSKRVEAVQMRLSGKLSDTHSVWYRAHSQTLGWLGWARDGQAAGTAGQSRRVEAVEVLVLPKGQKPADHVDGQASYVGAATGRAHVQGVGWASPKNPLELGTTGRGRRLEAMRLSVPNQPADGGISYEVHAQGIGWMPAAADGALAGTEGQSRRLEAVRISLTGDLAREGGYSVWYRVHSQTYGWLGWAHDGQDAGTAGLARRAEAIDVQVLPQGQVPRGYDAGKPACVNG